MSQKAEVYNDGIIAGILEKRSHEEYVFTYSDDYLNDPDAYGISLSLPKTQKEYTSSTLFPFFFGLLSEGVNKQTQCRLLKIDEKDHFSLLLKTAGLETIGSVTIKEIVL